MSKPLAGGRTKAQWDALHAEKPLDQRLHELNEFLDVDRERWIREELPEFRRQIIASGIVPRAAILDNVVSLEELINDPHEIWRQYWYSTNWYRVEIEA